MPTTLDFFKALFGGEEELEEGYLLITNLKGANKFTKKLSEAVEFAEELKETSDVYFGTGLYAKPRKKGHGDESDIIIRSFYCLDIDIAGPGHKKKELPETYDEAISLVSEAFQGVKPTAVVRSGGGVHVYFAFKEPVEFENPNEREIGKRMSTMFYRVARATFERHEYSLDNVSNLNRILRVPGTFNHKNEDRRAVELIELNPTQQINEDIVEELYTEDMEGAKRTKAAIAAGDNPLGLVIDKDANPPFIKLQGLLDTNILFKGNFNCKKSFCRAEKPNLSDFQMTMANIMHNHGWTDQEICNALIMHRRENSKDPNDPKITRLDYYTRTISRAHDKVEDRRSNVDEMKETAAKINTAETPAEKEKIKENCFDSLKMVLEANVTSIKEFVGLSEGKYYEIAIDGIPCKIENIDKLFNMSHVLNRISEVTKVVITSIKRKDWPKIVQVIISAAETVEVGIGMRDEEIVRDRIIMYVNESKLPKDMPDTDRDEAAAVVAPFKHNGDCYFFMAGFREWLSRRNDSIAPKVLSMALRYLGHSPETMAFRVDGKKTTRYVYKLNQDQL